MQPKHIFKRIISEGGGIMAEKLFANLTYEEAVRKYSDTVTGICVMRLQNMADAEDCYQNVFVKLYYKSPEFENDDHFKAWLIRVAIHECTSYMRKMRRQIPTETLHNEKTDIDYDSRDISWALMKTPPKYRDVLYLHYCEQYKVKEIAEILKTKENTVKSLLKRGREILRSVYGGENA